MKKGHQVNSTSSNKMADILVEFSNALFSSQYIHISVPVDVVETTTLVPSHPFQFIATGPWK